MSGEHGVNKPLGKRDGGAGGARVEKRAAAKVGAESERERKKEERERERGRKRVRGLPLL